jgi:clan AA aspartic protease (TIGR02281 family)
MIGIRRRWFLALFVTIAAGAAPRPASTAADSPEELLKARGLKRVGSTYVLASENEVQKKINDLKVLSNQLAQAARYQAGVEQQGQDEKGMLRAMLQRRVELNQQIAAFDEQIRNFGGAAPELIRQRNMVVNEYNGLGDQINLLRTGQASDPKLQDQLTAEVSKYRVRYIQAVLDLRQLVDTATKAYAELGGDAAVKDAIDALGRTSKAKLKLGPSAQFTNNVKLLERVERSVITDTVDIRKQNGVFVVDVMFNGKVHEPMVFDTGASLIMLPARLAEKIGLKPTPSDPIIKCETADGTVVEARRKTIPSVRVGRFEVKSVDCAIMPADKGDVAPLLGQSFLRHCTYEFTPESGHLVMSRVEGLEPGAPAASPSNRPGRAPTKGRARAGRPRGATAKAAPADAPDGDRPE